MNATSEFPTGFLIPEQSRHLVMMDLLSDMGIVDERGVSPTYASVWREAWNAAGKREPLDRHVHADIRMIDEAVANLAPGLTYQLHLLVAALMLLISMVRPGRALEVDGCEWTSATDAALDDLTLFDYGQLVADLGAKS